MDKAEISGNKIFKYSEKIKGIIFQREFALLN